MEQLHGTPLLGRTRKLCREGISPYDSRNVYGVPYIIAVGYVLTDIKFFHYKYYANPYCRGPVARQARGI